MNNTSILNAAKSTSAANRKDGNYAVPADKTENLDNNMTVTTSYRRTPTLASNEAMDNTLLKVNVKVEYKIRANSSDKRTVELESLKLTK